MTKILYCSCTHEYQDKHYGSGRRLHNEAAKKEWTCTVCGARKKGE